MRALRHYRAKRRLFSDRHTHFLKYPALEFDDPWVVLLILATYEIVALFKLNCVLKGGNDVSSRNVTVNQGSVSHCYAECTDGSL